MMRDTEVWETENREASSAWVTLPVWYIRRISSTSELVSFAL